MGSQTNSSPMGVYLNFHYEELPPWSVWLSTLVLSLVFVIGLPVNGATVLIFMRRKKLRHLVNFVLLLDCLSHILLCLICIPIQLVTAWTSTDDPIPAGFGTLSIVQHVVGNFANLHSTFLTVSIAILRYRRLCWKKKDKFSTMNAIKWSLGSGTLAVALTVAQSFSPFILEDDDEALMAFQLMKICVVVLSMTLVVFCYIRVSQRVWSNATNQEKLMDPVKLKKSRSVHLRAAIHSCVQIILVLLTLSPYLYEQSLQVFRILRSNHQISRADGSLWEFQTFDDGLPRTNESESSDKEGRGLTNSKSHLGQEDFTPSTTAMVESSDTHLARLIGITINYALLALGTPVAYIASCHRFREQFATIIFSHILNSPHNSACQSPNDARHQRAKNSSCSGMRADYRSQSGFPHSPEHAQTFTQSNGRSYSPCESTKAIGTTCGSRYKSVVRSSISGSNYTSNTTITFSRTSGSTRSHNSLKRNGSSNRKGSRGLLGSEFIIVDSESTTMLNEQDLSHSSNPHATPTPSPTSNVCHEERKASIICSERPTPLLCSTSDSISRKCSLQTILQNYGYDFSDLGEAV